MRITRQAMADTITDLKHAGLHALNPRPWFRHHPAVCGQEDEGGRDETEDERTSHDEVDEEL